MKQDVREKLLAIAEEFIDYLGISDLNVKDITVSGSNAAYSYTPHSDIDLHIVTDMRKLPDSPVYQELFTAKKNLFNADHNIKIKGYDVELYVQDSNKPVRTLGEYSVLHDTWNKFPSKRRANLDQAAVQHKFDKLAEISKAALRSNDMTALGQLVKTIKRYRQAGLDEHGEFGTENLAFKALRSHGIIDQLYDRMDRLKDRELSLDEMLAEASGYIPSEAEKDDPRFKTALTVDVHPDSIMQAAAQFGFKIARSGVPPTLKTSGKI